jgi:membrane protein
MNAWPLLRESFREWQRDNASQLAASTAYYTVFSLAPLVIIAISFAGLFIEPGAAENAAFTQVRSLFGEQGVEMVRSVIESSQASTQTPIAAAIGFAVLLIGASGLLVALQNALNYIWKVEPNKDANHFLLFILRRILSFGMILSVGFLLLVSLVVSAAIAFALDFLTARGAAIQPLLPVVDTVISLGIHASLFAALFKFLPDVRITWKDVWPGAFLTAALFTIGKTVLGYYLGRSNLAATYGIAGSVIMLLLWVNYSAQILFFGAEFTKVFSRKMLPVPEPRTFAHFTEDAAGHAIEKRSWWKRRKKKM